MASTGVNGHAGQDTPRTVRGTPPGGGDGAQPPRAAASTHARAAGALVEGWRLAGLKWHLLINTLGRSTWVLIGTIFGGLYVAGLLVLALGSLFALGNEPPRTVSTASILGGTVLLLAWWVVPVVSSKADASLDPSRLALFPLSLRGIQAGQVLGAAIGIPGAATVVVLAGWLMAWRSSPAALVAAAVCGILGCLLAFTGSRCVTAAAASLARHRRAGEILSIAFLVVLMLLGPIFGVLGRGLSEVWELLPRWAAALAWTPLGAVWAVPGDVAAGRWLPGLARVAIAVATLVVFAALWRLALRRALSQGSGAAARTGGRRLSGAGLFDRVPDRRWAVVAARCLIYWFKDPRYSASLVIFPAMAVVFWYMSGQAGGIMLVYPAIVALLLAYTLSADVSYDNTAFALHVLAPVRGRDDRLGRALALFAVAIPLLVVAFAVAMVRTGAWAYLPGLIGVCAALLLAGTGAVSVLSARYTYPTAPPGASPLKTPQGFTFLNVLVQFAVMALVAVLALPPVILVIAQLVTGASGWGWAALAVGALEGLVLLWIGVVAGGKWLDARGPELLQEVAGYR